MTTENQNHNYVAAIDIGTTKIVTIVGEKKENGKINILGMSRTPSKGVKRGVVLNIEDTVNAIQTTVESVQLKSGVMFSDVYVGIAGQHIRSLHNRSYVDSVSDDGEIKREDINRLVKEMYKLPIDVGEEIIHVIPQSYIVDNEVGVKRPVGMSGRRLEGNFHIVVGQIATAKNIEKCVNRVGLNIKQLILEPLASVQAVLTEDEREAGVALVDIGGGTTDIAVYYDNIIRHTAVIPFGGNVVTTDVKEGCSILYREAEALKVNYGSAVGESAPEDKVVTIPGISGREAREISFKSLAYIIQSRMEEIIDAIAFEIENSGFYDKLSAGIVITGGGAMLENLPQLVKYKTGLDVKVGKPSESLAVEVEEELNQPLYSTSVGLILQGYELQKQKAFFDREPEKEGSAKSVNKPKNKSRDKVSKSKKANRILDSFKMAITNIFDEDDAEM